MTARLTALVWPVGKPPSPTDADKAKAAEWVDAWFAREDFCPVWRARNRDHFIRSQAVTEMYDRLRKEAAEEWRPAPGYEGRYEVSSLGRARSLPRTEQSRIGPRRVAGGLLKPMKDDCGYLVIGLRIGGRRRMLRLHRLVCRAFHGEQPNPLHNEVAHLDGDRTNARADNLKWVSKRENMSHKRLHGTSRRTRNKTLTPSDVEAIRARFAEGETSASISRTYPVSPAAIRDIRRGRTWQHVPAKQSTDARKRA